MLEEEVHENSCTSSVVTFVAESEKELEEIEFEAALEQKQLPE